MTLSPLISDLSSLLGPQGLVTDLGLMGAYTCEMRGLYESHTPAVAKPNSTAQVAEIVKLCNLHSTQIVVQGGNTGLVGGATAQGELIVSLERLNSIESTDVSNLTMTVEAGVILANVQAAAEAVGTYFPLSLGAEGSCQIGGNLSTNAGGVHVLRYGNARDLVLGLEVVLADGQIWNGLKGLRKDNTGYDLKSLFLGAEGTLGIITRAVLRLFPAPQSKCVALVGCESSAQALSVLQMVRGRASEVLNAFEIMNDFSLQLAEKHIARIKSPLKTRHEYAVLIEFSSTHADADLKALMEDVLSDVFNAGHAPDATIAQNEAQAAAIWAIREAIPDAQRAEGASIKHDISVPVSAAPLFLERAQSLVEGAIPGVRVCAFGHLGDGNIHFNLSKPEHADAKDFLKEWNAINRAVHDLVMELGGSFSAEHGIGQLKTAEMSRLKDSIELDLMRTIKNALDPLGLLNPGKVIPGND